MKKSTSTALAATIKMLRLERGISQEALSRKIGVTRTCLANYELGLRCPDFETIIRIADIFGVLADFLTGRSSERCLELSENEVEETLNIKDIIKARGTRLDLSQLSEENQLHLLHYYDFLKNKNPLSGGSS